MVVVVECGLECGSLFWLVVDDEVVDDVGYLVGDVVDERCFKEGCDCFVFFIELCWVFVGNNDISLYIGSVYVCCVK